MFVYGRCQAVVEILVDPFFLKKGKGDSNSPVVWVASMQQILAMIILEVYGIVADIEVTANANGLHAGMRF